MNNLLHDVILKDASRLFMLLDRNPFGLTKGLFDRNYWHFKTTDFPSAGMQMGIAIMAKLYNIDGVYFKNKEILGYIEDGILATANIQHHDGTFDEWYPNERGWAGPTGYILNACCDTYLLVGKELSAEIESKLLSIISKAAHALVQTSEAHTLTNHIAMAWLPLVQAKVILKTSIFDDYISGLKKQIIKNFKQDEGWSVEYDGADPGYQSGTLSFLAKGLQLIQDKDLEEISKKSLRFMSYFAYPDGTVGGAIGSRHTVNFFIAGIVAWRHDSVGAALFKHSEMSFFKQTIVLPSDLDDHYYIYRLNEFLDAFLLLRKTTLSPEITPLPYEREHFMCFKEAGIVSQRKGEFLTVVSASRGGAVMAWNCQTGQQIANDNGVMIKLGQHYFTSLWQGQYKIEINEHVIQISGSLQKVTPKVFNVVSSIFFKAFVLVFGFHAKSAIAIKNLIRTVLMVHKSNSGHHFSRTVSITNKGILVNTKLRTSSKPSWVQIGGEFWSRYVPQSRHFLKCDLLKSQKNFTTTADTMNIDHTEIYRS